MSGLVQAVSLLGAALILIAFAALQRGRWGPAGRAYLWCNVVGAGLLTLVAFWDRRLGFIVLELAWTAMSAAGLWRARQRP
jgi:hypothetical protein